MWKIVLKTRLVPNGRYKEDKWMLYHNNKSKTSDISKEYIQQQYGKGFTKYCAELSQNKFHSTPRMAKKDSFLYEWPMIIKNEVPEIQCQQSGKGNLCIPKAFASILHYVGFKDEAKQVNDIFYVRKLAFIQCDTNMLFLLHI